jgi:transcriptional regulator with XRE-family HTH domain
MVERYGARMTLGESLAIASTMSRLCRVDRVTLAEIADATGLSKQNISRWAQKRMGQSIEVKYNEDDRRIKEIVLIDPRRGQEYVEALAQTLGIESRDP